MFSLLSENPLVFAIDLLAVLTALTVHEFSHALMAFSLGDSTAKDQGRLSLNPMVHLDWLGFIMFLFVGFGWGKPVPYNPYLLRFPRFGPVLVGLAGPAANLITAFLAGGAMLAFERYGLLPPENLLTQFLLFLVILNTIFMVFNLIPIPPLDGSKVLLALLHSPRYEAWRFFLETRGPVLLLALILLDRFTGISVFSGLFQGALKLISRVLG